MKVLLITLMLTLTSGNPAPDPQDIHFHFHEGESQELQHSPKHHDSTKKDRVKKAYPWNSRGLVQDISQDLYGSQGMKRTDLYDLQEITRTDSYGSKGIKRPDSIGTHGIKRPDFYGSIGIKKPDMYGSKGIEKTDIHGPRGIKKPDIYSSQGIKDPDMYGSQGIKIPDIYRAQGTKKPYLYGSQKTDVYGSQGIIKPDMYGSQWIKRSDLDGSSPRPKPGLYDDGKTPHNRWTSQLIGRCTIPKNCRRAEYLYRKLSQDFAVKEEMKITGAHHPLASLVLCLGLCAASESDIAVNYLKKFGYIPKEYITWSDNPGNTTQRPRNGSVVSVTEAVKNFQEFAGLTVTGELDDETLTLMNLPRCGVEDFAPTSAGNSSKYQTQGPWEKNALSYRVIRYSKKMSGALVNADVRRAFGFWSAATNLKFFYKEGGNVDIEIGFYTFEHGDGDAFDGSGGTLAHASFPRNGGDVHMDDSETWTENSKQGINFLQTLTHEIGHSLGLTHSRVSASVMAPFYRGWDPNFKLHFDDIQGIQYLYGRPNTTTSTTPIVFPTIKQPTRKPTTVGPPKRLGCPDMNTNTQGRQGIKRIDGIKTWSACSLKCLIDKDCKYWTWHHERAVGFEFRCVLMADFVTKADDSNTISGSSDCTCPMIGITPQGREDAKMIGLEPTWQECARKCSQSSHCAAWTWHPESAGGFARRCVHMSGYANLAEDRNTVSGSKTCT